MYFETPILIKFRLDVRRQFPDIKLGIYNRRHINNDPSRPYSQHSWPNAADLYFTVPAGDTTPSHQTRLQAVYQWIKYVWLPRNPGAIRYLLWKTANHYDHIHIDFYPYGWGTPSLTRGGSSNRYKTRDGRIITQAQLLEEGEDELALLTETEQKDLKDFLTFIKEEGSNVGFVKYAIQLIREERTKRLHGHANDPAPEPFNPEDYEIIIQRKEV